MHQGQHYQKPIDNKLWIARKRAGYPQKSVATLLGDRSLSVISEYENGRKLPSLRTALKLEIIYGTPLAELYPGLHGEFATELEGRKKLLPKYRRMTAPTANQTHV